MHFAQNYFIDDKFSVPSTWRAVGTSAASVDKGNTLSNSITHDDWL